MPGKKTMAIWNNRMLNLMDYCISNKVKCTNQKEWCKLIGITANTIKQIKDGGSSFRHIHLYNAGKVFDVSMEYLYGFSDKMKKNIDKNNVKDLLQQALVLLNTKKK